jgi:hypothetical protein
MRKINLKNYQVPGTDKDYKIKEVLCTLLFNPELKLLARDLFKQNLLAEKIEGSGESVLLEDNEYEKVKRAVETYKGWQRGDLEFIQRILEAPEVPVKEA